MESKFMKQARQAVVDYFNDRKAATNKNGDITLNDVFIVWFCKMLHNWKAMVSTTVSDGMYYEVTFNGDTGKMHLDA